MPDQEGFLCDDEVMVSGEVWRVSPSLAEPAFECEEQGCPRGAVIELSCASDHPDGGAWKCLCEEHFEQWKGNDNA